MNIISSLSVPIYEFQCDEKLIDEIYPEVKNMKYKPTAIDSSVDLSVDYFYNEKLIDWFESCLEEVRKIYFIDEIKLSVANCWTTRTSFIHKHHTHTHQQALAGGILYLEDSDSGETIFYENNPWHKYQNDNIMNIIDKKKFSNTGLVTKITPKKGKMILYPAHLRHGTGTNRSKKHRYTIAFDAFFSGRITENSTWPYVEIKTTTLREIHESKNKE